MGLCVFSLHISLVMIERIYILCIIIIIKWELVWTITHCLGLGHETMVCAVCLSVFLWKLWKRLAFSVTFTIFSTYNTSYWPRLTQCRIYCVWHQPFFTHCGLLPKKQWIYARITNKFNVRHICEIWNLSMIPYWNIRLHNALRGIYLKGPAMQKTFPYHDIFMYKSITMYHNSEIYVMTKLFACIVHHKI